jgi:hypothetical protein
VPVILWPLITVCLIAAFVLALSFGVTWLAVLAAALLGAVFAGAAYAVWQAWLSLRPGG